MPAIITQPSSREYSQLFTASGTWVRPANCDIVTLSLIGAGQETVDGTGFQGAGGNGGSSYLVTRCRVNADASVTVAANSATTFAGQDTVTVPPGGQGDNSGNAGAGGIPEPQLMGQPILFIPGSSGGAGSYGGTATAGNDLTYNGLTITGGTGGAGVGGKGGSGGSGGSWFAASAGSFANGSNADVAPTAPPALAWGCPGGNGGPSGGGGTQAGIGGFCLVTWFA